MFLIFSVKDRRDSVSVQVLDGGLLELQVGLTVVDEDDLSVGR
jgi:hypothetical protein